MSALILHSCELDNYDGPDATLSGRIIDKETGELVEQDIIRGTQIEFIEHGYDNPLTTRYRLGVLTSLRQNLWKLPLKEILLMISK